MILYSLTETETETKRQDSDVYFLEDVGPTSYGALKPALLD